MRAVAIDAGFVISPPQWPAGSGALCGLREKHPDVVSWESAGVQNE